MYAVDGDDAWQGSRGKMKGECGISGCRGGLWKGSVTRDHPEDKATENNGTQVSTQLSLENEFRPTLVY